MEVLQDDVSEEISEIPAITRPLMTQRHSDHDVTHANGGSRCPHGTDEQGISNGEGVPKDTTSQNNGDSDDIWVKRSQTSHRVDENKHETRNVSQMQTPSILVNDKTVLHTKKCDREADEDEQVFVSYRSSDAFQARSARRLNSDSFV